MATHMAQIRTPNTKRRSQVESTALVPKRPPDDCEHSVQAWPTIEVYDVSE